MNVINLGTATRDADTIAYSPLTVESITGETPFTDAKMPPSLPPEFALREAPR